MENVEKLLSVISEEFKVPVSVIKSKDRKAGVATSRHVFSLVCKNYLNISYVDIAKLLNCHCSSVTQGVGRLQTLIIENEEMRGKYFAVINAFFGKPAERDRTKYFFPADFSALQKPFISYYCFIIHGAKMEKIGKAFVERGQANLIFDDQHADKIKKGVCIPSYQFTGFSDAGKATSARVTAFIYQN